LQSLWEGVPNPKRPPGRNVGDSRAYRARNLGNEMSGRPGAALPPGYQARERRRSARATGFSWCR
jgi:hypothetical protein